MALMFDSHAHYDDARFDGDREEVISALRQGGVGWVINAGCDIKTTCAAISLAERYDFFYATAGFHPGETGRIADEHEALAWLREALRHPKVVALGEIGLDYHYEQPGKDVQSKWLELQLKLAEELSVPVVIHDRDAHGDIMDAVRAHPTVRGVFHSFSGSVEMARELVARGWYISVSGVVTFKNAARLPDVVAEAPIDRLLIETDAPYLSPHPHRGKRNDSRLMLYTAQRVAEIKGLSLDRLCELTAENTERLFGIKKA